MITKSCFWLVLAAAISMDVFAAEIYKTVDENGAVVFSDKKTHDAETIKVQPNVVDSKKPAIPAAHTQDTSKKQTSTMPKGSQNKVAESGTKSAVTQAELDKQCEMARERKLKPMREKLIEECVTEKRKDRDYCTRFYATYGDQIHHANGVVQPRMFHDLPECLKAFENSRSYRSGK